jgi:hypothetical protein
LSSSSRFADSTKGQKVLVKAMPKLQVMGEGLLSKPFQCPGWTDSLPGTKWDPQGTPLKEEYLVFLEPKSLLPETSEKERGTRCRWLTPVILTS